MKAGRAELIEFLNNLTVQQLQILFNASNAIQLDNFQSNKELLKDEKIEILESFLSQKEWDIFFNGKY